MKLPKKFAQKSRKAFYWIHLWTGLVIGLWFVMMGLTGAALAWKSDIMDWETRHRVAAPLPQPGEKIIPPSKAIEALQTAHPDLNVGRGLNVPNAKGGYYSAMISTRGQGEDAERVTKIYLINPVTAKVYPPIDESSLWIDITERFHWSLLLGVNGVRTNGFMTFFSLFMLISGIWLWWPSTLKQLKTRITWKRGVNLRRTLYDLHNMMGVYFLPMLMILVVTGLVICYNGQTDQSIRHAVNRLRGVKEEERPRRGFGGEGRGERRGRREEPANPDGPQPLGIDAMVEKARAAFPGNTLMSIRFARRPGQPFSASYDRFLLDGTGVQFDAITGKLLEGQALPNQPANPGNVFMSYMFQLHYGWFGGNWSKLIYCVTGFLPLGLFITGAWMYIKKKRFQRSRKNAPIAKSTPAKQEQVKEPVAV